MVSVAVARGDEVLAARVGAQRGSSAHLLDWIDGCLADAGTALDALGGAVALRGPGSFTGLRVGLATLLGFQQALRLPATALPTLDVLAAAASESHADGTLIALVPAGPADWFAQRFAPDWPPRPEGQPERVAASALLPRTGELWIVGSDEEAAALPSGGDVHVTGPLATVAARLASRFPPAWDESLLRSPLYLAAAPVSVPGPPKRVQPLGDPR